jgi:predicted RNase H-like nuclease (RuvC/YqgF family)
VEKIVEVPGPIQQVEVIKEVEKIVIKEVFIQDSVPNSDNIWDKDKLLKTIQGLEDDKERLSTKIDELTNEIQEFSAKTEETAKKFQDKQKSLQTTLQNLRKELKLKDDKILELENKLTTNGIDGQRAVYMSGSNINKTI